jgi:hypothetical protein
MLRDHDALDNAELAGVLPAADAAAVSRAAHMPMYCAGALRAAPR